MSLFDQLVDEALKNRPDLGVLRNVVEKELLHHDILREMSDAGMLSSLTFIGGTSLRACYGSERLSEDLDFTGGVEFKKEDLSDLAETLIDRLEKRYGLPVKVSEPKKSSGNVSTWKMAVETRPAQRHLPAQKIHIDICAIPSYDPQPMMLRNIYGVDLGTSGLIVQVQSREEILADKLIALAFRENRIKNRDLWDICWLNQQGIQLPPELISKKIRDHGRTREDFIKKTEERVTSLHSDPQVKSDFIKEMTRFLPTSSQRTVQSPDYWIYLNNTIDNQSRLALKSLE